MKHLLPKQPNLLTDNGYCQIPIFIKFKSTWTSQMNVRAWSGFRMMSVCRVTGAAVLLAALWKVLFSNALPGSEYSSI